MKTRIICILVVCFLLLPGTGLLAQPFTLDQNLFVKQIPLAADPKFFESGTSGSVEDTATAEGLYFFVKDLAINQGVYVAAVAAESDHPVRVRLHKLNWKESEREGQTDGEGMVDFTFRTQGDFGIVVEPVSNHADFYLVVWASEPAPLSPGTMMTPYTGSESKAAVENASGPESRSGGDRFFQYAVVGLLAVIAVFLGIMVLRRNKGATHLLILFALFLFSQGELQAKGGAVGKVSDILMDSQIGGAAYPRMDAALKDIVKYAKTAQGMGKGVEGLSKGDKETDLDQRGVPEVPSICVDNSACEKCYGDALTRLSKYRVAFIQLGAIGGQTRNFVKGSLSFGDGASGVHGITAIAWQAERRKIEASYKNFGEIYKNKYEELSQNLYEVLQEINQCEAEFGLPDWYNRFGFVMYESIRTIYAWHP